MVSFIIASIALIFSVALIIHQIIFNRRLYHLATNNHTKAALEILISEIQELNPGDDIKAVLNSWIIGSNLHPERVMKIQGKPK